MDTGGSEGPGHPQLRQGEPTSHSPFGPGQASRHSLLIKQGCLGVRSLTRATPALRLGTHVWLVPHRSWVVGDTQLLGGDGTPWARRATRHWRPLVGQSHAQRWGQRRSTALGPFLICFNHDNMIYFIYKYPSAQGITCQMTFSRWSHVHG